MERAWQYGSDEVRNDQNRDAEECERSLADWPDDEHDPAERVEGMESSGIVATPRVPSAHTFEDDMPDSFLTLPDTDVFGGPLFGAAVTPRQNRRQLFRSVDVYVRWLLDSKRDGCAGPIGLTPGELGECQREAAKLGLVCYDDVGVARLTEFGEHYADK